MSRGKFITCPRDEQCHTPHGRIIVEGIIVIEEITFPDRKTSYETCAVSRPQELADRWSSLVIGRDVVVLPTNLKHLPVGFITSAAYARIWTWMWQNGVYKCRYSKLNNTMPVHPERCTWYSRGKRICFFDDKKNEHYETGDELLDFDV